MNAYKRAMFEHGGGMHYLRLTARRFVFEGYRDTEGNLKVSLLLPFLLILIRLILSLIHLAWLILPLCCHEW